MLYDTAAGPPRSGSLLESVFLIISQRRRKAEYFGLKAQVMASILAGPGASAELSGQLSEILKEVSEQLLPFLNKGPTLDQEAKEVLEKWVSAGPMSVRAMPGVLDTNSMKLASRLKRAKEKAGTWKRS